MYQNGIFFIGLILVLGYITAFSGAIDYDWPKSESNSHSNIERVPCLQSDWNKETGACYITNTCNFTIYGFAMCDKNVSECGSKKSEGVAMCGNSKFLLGNNCKDYCQGLEWYKSTSSHCDVNGKCCYPPRTFC